MSSPAYLMQPLVQRLPVLLGELMNGLLRIPRFQRPFVWTVEQRLALVESIYKGMPIGSIMVWRTLQHDLPCHQQLGRFLLRESGPLAASSARQYLLDGHQRLTTLYGALAQGLVPEPLVRTGDERDEDEDDWPIYFDLEAREFRIAGKPQPTWLPLDKLFDPFELHVFQRKLTEQGLPRNLLNRSEHLAATFKDYSIPIIPIVTEDMELVTTSFKRINDAGTKMSEVHMVSALAWTRDFDLNERMDELREQLGGWRELDSQVILNCVKLALDLDLSKSSPEDVRDALQDRPAVLDEAVHNIGLATLFLGAACGVHGPLTLPYSYQLIILADCMRTVPDPPGIPQVVAEALQRWFWTTTYTEFFAGMNATTLRRALAEVHAIRHGQHPGLLSADQTIPALRRFDYRAARSRAWMLRLADRYRGGSGPVSCPAHEMLALHGNDAAFRLVPNRFIGTAIANTPENRLLIEPQEGPEFVRTLLKSPSSVPREVREVHAISDEVAQHLEDENHIAALLERGAILRDAERHFLMARGLLDYQSEVPW